MAIDSWNEKEDRRQSGGCSIALEETPKGICVKYALSVARFSVWKKRPILVLRSYESGELTVTREYLEE